MVWFRKAADSGNDEAVFELGEFYRLAYASYTSDLGIKSEDPAKALAWYRKAADLGNGKTVIMELEWKRIPKKSASGTTKELKSAIRAPC